jgi:energy-converting hydrogenase B subunit D
MSAEPVLDLLLAGLIVALAWRLLADDDLLRGATLFVAFGLFVAVAWARLDAPDIALAEAAIGSVITGVLVLEAAAALRRGRDRPAADDRVRQSIARRRS